MSVFIMSSKITVKALVLNFCNKADEHNGIHYICNAFGVPLNSNDTYVFDTLFATHLHSLIIVFLSYFIKQLSRINRDYHSIAEITHVLIRVSAVNM